MKKQKETIYFLSKVCYPLYKEVLSMAQKMLYPVINGMKECGVCGKILPIENFTKLKGKYYSSKCKECANEYSRKYREKNKLLTANLLIY